MIKKEDYVLLLFFSILLIIFPVVLGLDGTGSTLNPFQIANCTDLNQTRNNLTAYYILNNTIDCSDTINWTGGTGFLPIGDSAVKFTGNFNGQNYTISNLFINRSTNDLGLFGATNGAVITDVGLTDINISGNSGNNRVAGLIGSSNSGSVTNSYTTGTVNGSSYVGGLIGDSTGTNVTNSYSTVTVEGHNTYVGGLMGTNDGGIVINSYATGTVNGTGAASVGGLIGQNSENDDGTIIDSYATGNVFGVSEVGGLVGYNGESTGTITNSYATGNVTGTGGDAIGGLVGNHELGTITNSFSTGHVFLSSSNIGGLVGTLAGTIVDSYWLNNSGDDATTCYNGGNSGCTVKTTTSYFFDVGNAPLVNWTFPPWSTVCNVQGYPSLNLQNISNTTLCLSFTADTTPPSTIVTLNSIVGSTSSIDWAWTSPSDSDFNSSILNLDGVNVANTSNNFYNATGLTCGTEYNLTIQTKDNVGNINTTDVTNLNTTSACVTTSTSSGGRSSVFTLSDTTKEQSMYKDSTFEFRTITSSFDNYQYHTLNVNEINPDSVNFTIFSTPHQFYLRLSETAKTDLDDDEIYDVVVTLLSISNRRAKFGFKTIMEEINVARPVTKYIERQEPGVEEYGETPVIETMTKSLEEIKIIDQEKKEKEKPYSKTVFVLGISILVSVFVLLTYFKKWYK